MLVLMPESIKKYRINLVYLWFFGDVLGFQRFALYRIRSFLSSWKTYIHFGKDKYNFSNKYLLKEIYLLNVSNDSSYVLK